MAERRHSLELLSGKVQAARKGKKNVRKEREKSRLPHPTTTAKRDSTL